MRSTCALLLATLVCPGAVAQPLRFQQITTDQGLSDNAITALLQDRDGFLWVGTENGLNRYDGSSIRNWHRKDGLSGEHVSALMQDDQGSIWVACREGGLARLEQGEVVTTYRVGRPGNMAEVRPICLFDLNDSVLMIGAERAPLIFLNKRSGRFTYWPGAGPISPANAIPRPPPTTDWCNYITDIGGGHLAIGFLQGFKQWIVDRQTGARIGESFPMDPERDQTIVAALRMGDRLYGAGWQRVIHAHPIDGKQPADLLLPVPDECTALLALDSLHLLAGTATNGLLAINLRTGQTGRFRHDRGDLRSLSDDRVSALLKARDGSVWAGTRNGLNVHAPERWWTQEVPFPAVADSDAPDAFPAAIAQNKDGELLICTFAGLLRYREGRPMEPVPLGGHLRLRTTCIVETDHGTALGTEEGLYRLAPNGRSASPWPLRELGRRGTPGSLDPPGLLQIRGIFPDTVMGRPALVLGIRGYGVGLVDIRQGTLQYFLNQPGVPGSIGSNLTTKLVRDRNGQYWVGTSNGLYQWQMDRKAPKDQFRAFRAADPANPLPANNVTDLLTDGRGLLWVAMRNGGLACWNGRAMRAWTPPGSKDQSVFSMAMDRRGRIWCAITGGFAVLDTTNGTWDQLPLQNTQGMPSIPACTRLLADGRIAFIADNALQLFDPERTPRGLPPPPPYLTSMMLSDSSLADKLHHGKLALGRKDGMLRVTISALDLVPLAPYRFTLELEGIDPAPRFTDEQGSIVYASMPSGHYRLLARTVTAGGLQSAPVVLAVIDKAKPIRQRWWFYLAMVVAAAAFTYALSRFRYHQRLKLQQVRNRIASDLHDEVGSSLSAITIGSQLAARLGEGQHDRLMDLLARISDTSSASLNRMRAIVWAIDPKNDEGEALVGRMRRVAQELLADKGITASFRTTGGIEDMKLPMDVRKELLLLFKEAVNNCSKHAAATHVQIGLHRTGNRIRLEVVDDGKGFDPALHPDGQGLGSMAQRAQALGTELQLRSAPGKGTVVCVELRLTRIRD